VSRPVNTDRDNPAKKSLVVKGGRIITPQEERFTNLWLENGRILGLADKLTQLMPGRDEADFEVYEAGGQYVTPGLIDLQMNGGPACDLWADPSVAELESLRLELAAKGVTSFLPTLITDDLIHLRKNIDFLTSQGADRKPVMQIKAEAAMSRMLGLHLEGPCLSPERPGVHPRKHIQAFTVEILKQIITPAISLITAACEGDTDGAAISYLKESGVTVSLGHSNATYEEANLAFDRGATMMTHTFNALPPLHHRTPGAVGAALLRDDIVCCLIADGLHLSPPACAIILKMKSWKKAVLVTDRAKIGTTKGGLVGSSISLDEAVQNVCRWGFATFPEAIAMATANAAAAVGLGEAIGTIRAGLPADLAFFDEQSLTLTGSIVGGHWIKRDGKLSPLLALAQGDARH
jgi:N-acetylglucosamine-6-phosphate deacetylase